MIIDQGKYMGFHYRIEEERGKWSFAVGSMLPALKASNPKPAIFHLLHRESMTGREGHQHSPQIHIWATDRIKDLIAKGVITP